MSARPESPEEEEARRIFNNDTGPHSSEELTRRLYNMEKDALRCSSRIESRLAMLEAKIQTIIEKVSDFVTMARYRPVELIAYGLVAGVMLTVLGALLSRVVIR